MSTDNMDTIDKLADVEDADVEVAYVEVVEEVVVEAEQGAPTAGQKRRMTMADYCKRCRF